MLGTPSDLLSCHAGLVGGYALEGHVPAVAVTRLLAERPAGIRGLAVPGMPIGSSERDAYRIATGVIPKGRLISSSFFLTFEAFNNSRLRAALAASASAPWVFLESGACGGRGIYSPGLDHIALNARKFVNLSVVHQPR
ncbi:DUF411 domain-containing protein [Rhodovarius sp.]|uniref:DUF411 domain-containing protein n=1 Tax=Rhodovarius sp. TaxID=2972673 RepID=UPI0034A35FA0